MPDTLTTAPFEIHLGAATLKCDPVTAADRQALRQWIRDRRIEAIQRTCAVYSAELLGRALAHAACQPVTEAELQATMTSEDGMLFLLWRGIGRHHPELTLERVADLIPTGRLADLCRQQFRLSGLLADDDAAEPDPHRLRPETDYDLHLAILMRFYRLSPDAASRLTQAQIGRLIEMIPEVKRYTD